MDLGFGVHRLQESTRFSSNRSDNIQMSFCAVHQAQRDRAEWSF
jgi:hypothetical protein